MAARVSAAALSYLIRCFLVCLAGITWQMYGKLCQAQCVYSRTNLISIGLRSNVPVTDYFQQAHNIPLEISRASGSPWIVTGSCRQRRRRRRNRKQKRGCRAGLLLRLKKHPHKPPLPSVFLTNVRSIVHKMDDLELRIATNNFARDCCVMILSETWLHPAIPDNAVQLAGRIIHRLDRNSIYINNDWCSQSHVTYKYCSPHLEAITVICRPFYLPREITVVTITAVYIPPDANVNIAHSYLHGCISKQQQAHPDGVHIVAGDFNRACLKAVLPKFTQYVKCATRENTRSCLLQY